MKIIINILVSLTMAALMLTACSNEEWLSTVTTNGVLTASVEGGHSGTRAGFDKGGNFYWSNVDHIGVTSTGNPNGFTALDLAEGGGTGSATFTGSVTGEIGAYAVYPYNSNHRVDGNNLVYNFPSEYKYDKVDVDFFTANQGAGNSFNPAMFGHIKDGGVKLKHLGGVICIKIEEMPVAFGTLELSADKKITGEFSVPLSGNQPDGNMACLADKETAATGNTVTINFSRATVSSGVFYVPVPVGTYNLDIKVYDSATPPKIQINAGTYTINRCDLKKIELRKETADAVFSESLEDVTSKLEGHNVVRLSSEITSSENKITIPADNGSETSKSLFLEKVATEASLTVTDANASGDNTSNSVDNFTLSIPNKESDNFTPLNVNIEMPNTTVTLAGNGGGAKYGRVEAKTADNTLVVGSGVEVAELVVVKGNVRVNQGATLKAITKGAGNTAEKVTIIKEDGATIPTGLSIDFEVKDVDVADELHNVAAKGGEYTLTTDVTGDFVISAPISSPVSINLNGYTITNKTGDTFTVNKGSRLTIKGYGTVDNISHGKACIYNNGTVDLYGGTYTRSKENGQSAEDAGGNSYYNILNHGSMKIYSGVTVKQTDHFSSLVANGYCDYASGDPRFGYVEETNHSGPKLRINGGEFSGGLNTIQNDENGFLDIIGGSFTNNTQSTIRNHHEASIQNGEFNASNTAEYVIENHGYNATHDKGKMSISGGRITGKIVDNGSIPSGMSVTGGTFSDFSVMDYLADNAYVNITPIEDVDLIKQIVTKGNVTLNLNGKEISNTNAIRSEPDGLWSLISVQAGTLTIKGNGKLSALENDCYAVDVRNGATLNIEGGVYVGNVHAVYVLNGTANIKGGEYSIQQTYTNDTSKAYEFVLDCYDAHYQNNSANIVVTGGTFHKFNPASNGAEGDIGSTNFCAEGYTSTTSDGGETWVVSASQ